MEILQKEKFDQCVRFHERAATVCNDFNKVWSQVDHLPELDLNHTRPIFKMHPKKYMTESYQKIVEHEKVSQGNSLVEIKYKDLNLKEFENVLSDLYKQILDLNSDIPADLYGGFFDLDNLEFEDKIYLGERGRDAIKKACTVKIDKEKQAKLARAEKLAMAFNEALTDSSRPIVTIQEFRQNTDAKPLVIIRGGKAYVSPNLF